MHTKINIKKQNYIFSEKAQQINNIKLFKNNPLPQAQVPKNGRHEAINEKLNDVLRKYNYITQVLVMQIIGTSYKQRSYIFTIDTYIKKKTKNFQR